MKSKIYFLLFFSLISVVCFAQLGQVITQTQIDLMKGEGRMPANFSIKNPNVNSMLINPRIYPPVSPATNGTVCNCMISLDSTFSIVQFDGSGGSGGPGVPPDYRNDDWSTVAIALPFSYCFFGIPVSSIFINNNGNISFSAAYSTFTANSFPDSSFIMIAPFWADVDTRGAMSGVVHYKVTATSVVIIWDHVGYYGTHDDKLNTFQLIMTDGSDPIVTGGNTSFCYGDMQWTTGDASTGVGGFGGTPATVGANRGNGIDYIQFGLYDTAGIAFDGAYGLNDGVDWLDSSNFIFDLCPTNVPPVPVDCINDTVYVHVADTNVLNIAFFSPEIGQSTSISVNAGPLANFSVLSNTAGNYATYSAQLVADALNIGDNVITVTATDNGSPVQTRTYNRVIHVDQATGISEENNSAFSLFPNPFNIEATIRLNKEYSENTTFTLTDITGREILRQEKISSGFHIHKSETGSGIFIYRIFNGVMNRTGKIIVY